MGSKDAADKEQILAKFSSPAEIELYRASHRFQPPPQLLALAGSYLDPGDLALGVACGTGRELWALRRAGYRRLVGMDLSLPMLQAACDLAPDHEARRRLVQMDAERFGFRPGSFAGVLILDQMLSVVPGSERRKTVLRAVRELVPPGGGLVLSYLRRREDWKYRVYFAATVPVFALGRRLGLTALEPGDRMTSVTAGKATPGRIRFHYFRKDEVVRLLEDTGWSQVQDGGGTHAVGFMAARRAPAT